MGATRRLWLCRLEALVTRTCYLHAGVVNLPGLVDAAHSTLRTKGNTLYCIVEQGGVLVSCDRLCCRDTITGASPHRPAHGLATEQQRIFNFLPWHRRPD